MKESVWGYWIVVLGIGVISAMMFMQNYTTTNEEDYYMIKSVLQASMYEAIDYGFFQDKGVFKINAEKFEENFIRRISETLNFNKKYVINTYYISENPPAVSVAISTKTQDSNVGKNAVATDSVDVVSQLTGILYTTENAKYKPRA